MKKGELSISVHYRPLRRQLVQNVNLYRKGSRRIVFDPEFLGGEAVFKGTRIRWSTLQACSEKESPGWRFERTTMLSATLIWRLLPFTFA